MSFAFTGSENAMERTTRLLLGDKTLQGIREQANANENIAKTSFAYPTLGEVNKKLVTKYISPKIFKNRWIRNLVWLTQRYLP